MKRLEGNVAHFKQMFYFVIIWCTEIVGKSNICNSHTSAAGFVRDDRQRDLWYCSFSRLSFDVSMWIGRQALISTFATTYFNSTQVLTDFRVNWLNRGCFVFLMILCHLSCFTSVMWNWPEEVFYFQLGNVWIKVNSYWRCDACHFLKANQKNILNSV